MGQNYIVDSRTINAKTRDGKTPETKWYLFRIPIDQYERRYGSINDFSSIRFMRMFMTGFDQPVVLRLATLNLVRGELARLRTASLHHWTRWTIGRNGGKCGEL